MANCKDCLHYQVCGYVMDMSDDEIEEPGAEKACQHFLRDAARVVHGYWSIILDDYDNEMMQCSICGAEFYDGDNDTVEHFSNYCPNCGAKMDGGKEK